MKKTEDFDSPRIRFYAYKYEKDKYIIFDILFRDDEIFNIYRESVVKKNIIVYIGRVNLQEYDNRQKG